MSLFGCRHKRTTWPQAAKHPNAYVVCLDCGREFPYNWREMRMEPRTGKPYSPPPVTPPEEA